MMFSKKSIAGALAVSVGTLVGYLNFAAAKKSEITDRVFFDIEIDGNAAGRWGGDTTDEVYFLILTERLKEGEEEITWNSNYTRKSGEKLRRRSLEIDRKAEEGEKEITWNIWNSGGKWGGDNTDNV
jgi:hypothetical protein